MLNRFTFLCLAAVLLVLAGLQNFNYQTLTATVNKAERVCSRGTDGQGECKYLIFTSAGVLENADALLHFKFDSSDIYNDMLPGSTHQFTVVGWRIPFLSMYKNILSATPVKPAAAGTIKEPS